MKLHKMIAVVALSGVASVSLNASAGLSNDTAAVEAQKTAIFFNDDAAQRAAVIFGKETTQKSSICGRIVAQNVDMDTAGYWINRCNTECGGHITRMGWGGLTVRCN